MDVDPPSTLLRKLKRKLSPEGSFHEDMHGRLVAAAQMLKEERGLELVEIEESFGWSFGLARANVVPVVVRLHGPWFLNGVFESEAATSARWRVAAEERGIQAATLVTAPSADVLKRVRKKYNTALNDARVIKNPIHLQPDTQIWSLGSCATHKLLYVGRFDERKGGDIVLQAFAALAKANKDLSLTFIGPDLGINRNGRKLYFQEFVRDVLPEYCWSRIHYLGKLDHDKVMDLRSKHFLTIVASQFEILPYAVLEAMSFGCPIVSSSVGGIPELIRDEQNGLLYEAGDASGLATQCQRLLDDPNWATQLSAAAIGFCRDNLGSHSIATETLRAYQAAVDLFAKARRQ